MLSEYSITGFPFLSLINIYAQICVDYCFKNRRGPVVARGIWPGLTEATSYP